MVLSDNKVDIYLKEKKSGTLSSKNRRSVTEAFSYAGGSEKAAYLISKDKFVGMQRTADYLYKVAYSHTNTKVGDKITFTVGSIDESLTIFHFSSNFVSELDEKCKIDSKTSYNYTYFYHYITNFIVN